MTDDRESIFVFGASGHGKVVIDVIERQGTYRIAYLVDDDPVLKGSSFFGYSVIGGRRELLAAAEPGSRGIVAIGSNRARGAVSQWLTANDFGLVVALHPAASVGRAVEVGEGTVVMAGAVINSGSTIGRNVIVNTRASVDHDCIIGDNVHIAPGSTLCGTVTVGDGTFVCAGATVLPNRTLGAEVVVGAGSTVVRDVAFGKTVVGIPARELVK